MSQKLELWVGDPDRFLQTCYLLNCALDGMQIVDFSGFKNAPPDARRPFKIECKGCGRRFVGELVEKTEP